MPEPIAVPSAAIDRDNPWPGLASFTEDARAFFFGREKETEELVRLIRRNTLTVLFGQSGLGKSSLLQAGAFPLLREADFLPLYLRLDHHPAAVPLADQVKAALVDAFQSVGADAPAPRADETLWEYFHRKDIDIWSAKNRLLTPVLAFDQFEEIFTLGRAGEVQRERGRAFLAELADLVENRAPAALREQFDAGALDIARYNFDKPSCQVVLSLREDFLPDLEGLKHEMRSIMHSRMRVKRLNGTQALEIVSRPAPHLLAEGVAERVVEFVAGARGGSAERFAELEVEPALLSVICRELNERRRALGQPQITADLVSGNRREILTNFYERSVADLPEAMRTFVEDHLLTKSGFRDNLALETALEFPGVTRPLIDMLVSRRLIRIEDRLGVQRVELTHDVLAEVIRASRDERQQRLAVEQLHERERVTRRRMWLARTIAAGLLVGLAGVSWIAWRALRAEREQERLRSEETVLRQREAGLRQEAQTRELAARRHAYASDLRALQVALEENNLGRARQLLNRQRPKSGESDLRGWEWRYLWQLCRNEAQSVLGQLPFPAISLAASPDGNWIAAGENYDGGLTLWNRSRNEKIRVPAGTGYVMVAFSPAEPLLAISIIAADAPITRVLIWNLESRSIVRELPMPTSIYGLVFSADGKTLLTGGFGARSEVVVWRVADGTPVARCPAPNPVKQSRWSFVATTADLKLAAYGSEDGNVNLLDLATGQRRWSARGANERVLALRFSPDGKTLASGAGYEESAIRLWDVDTGREIRRLEGHTRFISKLEFSTDGKTLFSASGDQTLRLWETDSGRLLRTLRGHEAEVWSMARLPDDRTLVSGAKDGSLYIWDTRAPVIAPVVVLPTRPSAWRFLGTGESVLMIERDGKVSRRSGPDLLQSDPIMEVDPVPDPFSYQPLLANDCELLAQGARRTRESPDTKIKIWDWERRVQIAEITTNLQQSITPLRFTPGGKSLLAINGNGFGTTVTLREWDIASGREIGSWPLPSSTNYRNFTFSPDAKQVMIMDYGDRHFHLDRATNRSTPLSFDLKRTPAERGGGFSPDAKLFAAPSQSGVLRVLDATQPNFPERAVLSAGVTAFHSANFSPDGQRLLSGSSGRTAVVFWDVNSFEPLLVLSSASSVFRAPTFSPDGNSLGATSGVGGTGALTVWRAPSWAEIEKAEADGASSLSDSVLHR